MRTGGSFWISFRASNPFAACPGPYPGFRGAEYPKGRGGIVIPDNKKISVSYILHQMPLFWYMNGKSTPDIHYGIHTYESPMHLDIFLGYR